MTETKAEGKCKGWNVEQVEEKKNRTKYTKSQLRALAKSTHSNAQRKKSTEILVWKCCRSQQGEKCRVQQRWPES
jgi:hypothetical protein